MREMQFGKGYLLETRAERLLEATRDGFLSPIAVQCTGVYEDVHSAAVGFSGQDDALEEVEVGVRLE